MKEPTAGFREVEHTADWELEVWAPDLACLLEQAARGMMALAGIRLKDGPRFHRVITLRGEDPETLLVKFLNELLFLNETEGLAFDTFDISILPGSIEAKIAGASVAHQDKVIKAVTYHNLTIRQTPEGLRVNLVFDV